jgi:hypothetical protein
MKSKTKRFKKGDSVTKRKRGKYSLFAGIAVAVLVAVGSIVGVINHYRTADATVADPTWSTLGTGVNGGAGGFTEVSAIAIAPNGDVYAGGNFATAGGVTVNSIARWDGTNWYALDSGVSEGGGFIVWVHSIAIAPNGDVYVGGRFATAGGITVNNIARWDGTNWNALGTGVIGSSVRDIAFAPNGDVCAGGTFEIASGTTVHNVACWNGTNWYALGSGVLTSWNPTGAGIPSANIDSIAIAPNGNIYVGGNLPDVNNPITGNNLVWGIAYWDGTTWKPLGSGLASRILTIVFAPNGDICTGSTSGEITCWDGTTWNTIVTPNGGGWGNSIAFATNGDMYIGGLMNVGGNSANYAITRWDGTNFNPLNLGIGGNIHAIAIASNGDVYIGASGGGILEGDINSGVTGFTPINSIAMWDGMRITNTPPTLPSLSAPTDNSSANNTISIGGVVNDPDAGQVLTVQYQIGGISGAWNDLMTINTPADNVSFTGDIDVSGLEEGDHIVYMRVCDNATPMACSDPISTEFNIDRTDTDGDGGDGTDTDDSNGGADIEVPNTGGLLARYGVGGMSAMSVVAIVAVATGVWFVRRKLSKKA